MIITTPDLKSAAVEAAYASLSDEEREAVDAAVRLADHALDRWKPKRPRGIGDVALLEIIGKIALLFAELEEEDVRKSSHRRSRGRLLAQSSD